VTPLSVLDLAPIVEGQTAAHALRNSLELARHAERLGYTRYWVAEHHNMQGIASAATSVVIGHLAGGTARIRVGAGGIMLPNHAPLLIAEQFGTLAALFPGRVDLGLGRAPGSDQRVAQAMRRTLSGGPDEFPRDVMELQAYFAGEARLGFQATPGAGEEVPLWILGSSLYGAQLAAALGLPYAFASHFAPDALQAALAEYHQRFRPSAQLGAPYAMAGVNVFVADTEREAQRLFTSAQQQFTTMTRNRRGKLQPPLDDIEAYWTPPEKVQVCAMLKYSFVGSPGTVRERLLEFVQRTGVDEVMVVSAIYDHAARLRSYELLANTFLTK
jgi:luciferase family oxidoreductase group 1